MIYRKADLSDIPAIRHLWQMVFEDEDSYLDLYFDRLFQAEMTWLAETEEKQIVSMSILYAHQDFLYEGASLSSCPCVYAVATDPAYRGHGYAMELIRMQLDELDQEKDAPLSMIAPADRGLADLYAEKFSYKDAFFADKMEFRPYDFLISEENIPKDLIIRELNPSDYNQIREILLEGKNHLVYRDAQLSFLQESFKANGGGLFELRRSYAGDSLRAGIFALERLSEERVRIHELLLPEESLLDAMMKIQDSFKAEKYEVRMVPWLNRETVELLLEEGYLGAFLDLGPAPVAMLRSKYSQALEEKISSMCYAAFIFD